MSTQPILLFGGTFDPVHNGHVALLEGAIAALKPSITFVFPAGNPWQKTARAPIDGASLVGRSVEVEFVAHGPQLRIAAFRLP